MDPFTGDLKGELNLNDWLPTFKRVAKWNQWTEEELLLQLAGHLRGRTFCDWNLMSSDDRQSYSRVLQALKERVDTGQRALAVQDFRHLHQSDNETAGDFIDRLEMTFQLAYGADVMAKETWLRLLQGQLQEGLRDKILESQIVVGSLDYTALCPAAKNEERRLTELARRHHHRASGSSKGSTTPPAWQTSPLAKETAKSKPPDPKLVPHQSALTVVVVDNSSTTISTPPLPEQRAKASTHKPSPVLSLSQLSTKTLQRRTLLIFSIQIQTTKHTLFKSRIKAAVSSMLALLCRVCPARA